jgi:hypothetical protein
MVVFEGGPGLKTRLCSIRFAGSGTKPATVNILSLSYNHLLYLETRGVRQLTVALQIKSGRVLQSMSTEV